MYAPLSRNAFWICGALQIKIIIITFLSYFVVPFCCNVSLSARHGAAGLVPGGVPPSPEGVPRVEDKEQEEQRDGHLGGACSQSCH